MWKYEGREFTQDMVGDYVGFVYIIEHLESGKKYVGKKGFLASKTIQRKGKKKRVRVPSDWQSYWGSSDSLHSDVLALGEDKFERRIIRLCKTKTELGYYELKYQVENDVLLKPDEYWNNFVGYKCHRKNLIKGLKNA